ncbi:MAG: hypothetical protein GEV07_12745 [Streptosporangiales bacterium]|nr:hypothetical protein [Streptosporangiales bacterium]
MTTSVRGIAAAVLVTAFVTGTTGCGIFGDGQEGNTPHPSIRKSGPTESVSNRPDKEPGAYSTPDPDDVDFTEPKAVCDAFTDSLFSGDPVHEGQTQPIARAAEYVTPDYEKPFLSNAPRLAHWEDWDDAGATQLRRIRLPSVVDDAPKDKQTRKYRAAARRVIPSDSEGNPVGQTITFRVYCTLDDVDGNWLVYDHSQEEIDVP